MCKCKKEYILKDKYEPEYGCIRTNKSYQPYKVYKTRIRWQRKVKREKSKSVNEAAI